MKARLEAVIMEYLIGEMVDLLNELVKVLRLNRQQAKGLLVEAARNASVGDMMGDEPDATIPC